MKGIIIYHSKYGSTKHCADLLQCNLTADFHLASVDSPINLTEYDTVILGSDVHMGKISKEMRRFCKENEQALLQKTVHLYLCCALPENMPSYLIKSLSKKLYSHLSIKTCFGGELHPERMNFWDKTLTTSIQKEMEKAGRPAPHLFKGDIYAFCQEVQS